MNGANWHLDESGNIKASSVIGWSVATVGGVFILVQIQEANSDGDLKLMMAGQKAPQLHQLQMTVAQSLEFAKALERAAERALTPQNEPSQ